MEKPTKETKLTITTHLHKPGSKQDPNKWEIVTGEQDTLHHVTVERGETKMYMALPALFDLLTKKVMEAEMLAITKAMRKTQKEFFKYRNADILAQAKDYEKQLDALIERLENPSLF